MNSMENTNIQVKNLKSYMNIRIYPETNNSLRQLYNNIKESGFLTPNIESQLNSEINNAVFREFLNALIQLYPAQFSGNIFQTRTTRSLNVENIIRRFGERSRNYGNIANNIQNFHNFAKNKPFASIPHPLFFKTIMEFFNKLLRKGSSSALPNIKRSIAQFYYNEVRALILSNDRISKYMYFKNYLDYY
jgi:hypothetical protein